METFASSLEVDVSWALLDKLNTFDTCELVKYDAELFKLELCSIELDVEGISVLNKLTTELAKLAFIVVIGSTELCASRLVVNGSTVVRLGK